MLLKPDFLIFDLSVWDKQYLTKSVMLYMYILLVSLNCWYNCIGQFLFERTHRVLTQQHYAVIRMNTTPCFTQWIHAVYVYSMLY